MKVIAEGKNKPVWWIGLQVSCATCGRVVQLEAGDGGHANFIPSECGSVSVYCDNCGTLMKGYYRPLGKNKKRMVVKL